MRKRETNTHPKHTQTELDRTTDKQTETGTQRERQKDRERQSGEGRGKSPLQAPSHQWYSSEESEHYKLPPATGSHYDS